MIRVVVKIVMTNDDHGDGIRWLMVKMINMVKMHGDNGGDDDDHNVDHWQ